MIKVEVRMNVNLIKEAGEYDPDRILRSVDAAYMQYAARKEVYEDGTVCYWGHGNKSDFGRFGSLMRALKQEEWFMKYVDKWYWYNNSSMPHKEWFIQEDILEQMGLGASA